LKSVLIEVSTRVALVSPPNVEFNAAAEVDIIMASEQKASLSDYFAAERTLLAWIRTGLALMGFGFVVARFGLFLEELEVAERVPLRASTGFSLWFGIALIATGVLVSVSAGWHHLRLVRELDRGETSRAHSSTQAIVIAFFLALVGLALAIYLVTVGSSAHPHF